MTVNKYLKSMIQPNIFKVSQIEIGVGGSKRRKVYSAIVKNVDRGLQILEQGSRCPVLSKNN